MTAMIEEQSLSNLSEEGQIQDSKSGKDHYFLSFFHFSSLLFSSLLFYSILFSSLLSTKEEARCPLQSNLMIMLRNIRVISGVFQVNQKSKI